MDLEVLYPIFRSAQVIHQCLPNVEMASATKHDIISHHLLCIFPHVKWCNANIGPTTQVHLYILSYCIFLIKTRIMYTSSTAQGSGGSFINRKPIGEVGCCESGIAERSP